jgi:hypothetical protein
MEVTNLTSGGNLVNTEVRQHDDDNNSEENLGISSKTFEDFTVNVMKEFETLKANIQAQSDQLGGKLDSKFKSEISNLSATIKVQVENTYRILSEHLMRQFREKTEKLNGDLYEKIRCEVQSLYQSFSQLGKDTETEILSINDSENRGRRERKFSEQMRE